MAPGNPNGEAGLGKGLRKKGVAEECFRTGGFAGVDIGTAGKTRGVDDKRRFFLLEMLPKQRELGVIEFLAAQSAKGFPAALELRGKSLANVTGGTK